MRDPIDYPEKIRTFAEMLVHHCARISLVEGRVCNALPPFDKSDNRADLRPIVLHMFYAFDGITPPRPLQGRKSNLRKSFAKIQEKS